MSVVLARVDNRLVHGQVLESWIPRLDVNTVLVVDDGVAGDPLRQSIMEIAVPTRIECLFSRVDQFKEELERANVPGRRVMVLFSTIKDVRDVIRMGAPLDKINIGNVHYQKGKKKVSTCVSLDEDEMHYMMEIQRRAKVEIQTLPDDDPMGFPECFEKLGSGEHEAPKTKWWDKLIGKIS